MIKKNTSHRSLYSFSAVLAALLIALLIVPDLALAADATTVPAFIAPVATVPQDTPPSPSTAPSNALPEIISPASGQIVTSRGAIALKWKPLANAKSYSYIAQFNAFGDWTDYGYETAAKVTSGTISLDSDFLRAYGKGIDMRWHVKAKDAKGAVIATSDWTPFQFTLGHNPVPAAPTVKGLTRYYLRNRKPTKKTITKKKTTKKTAKKK